MLSTTLQVERTYNHGRIIPGYAHTIKAAFIIFEYLNDEGASRLFGDWRWKPPSWQDRVPQWAKDRYSSWDDFWEHEHKGTWCLLGTSLSLFNMGSVIPLAFLSNFDALSSQLTTTRNDGYYPRLDRNGQFLESGGYVDFKWGIRSVFPGVTEPTTVFVFR